MKFFARKLFLTLLFYFVFFFFLYNHPVILAQNTTSGIVDSIELKGRNFAHVRSSLNYSFHPEDFQWLSVGVNGGIINNADLNKFFQLEVTSGRYIDEDNYIQLVCGYGWIVLNKKRNLINSFDKDIAIFNFGLEFKTFYPSRYTDRIQYILIGAGFSSLSLSLKYPVEIEYYDYLPDRVTVIEKIRDDRLGAIDIHAGLGFNVLSTPDTRFCAEISPGILLPAKTTSQGFENDIFQKSFFLKLKFTLYFANNEL